MYKRSYGSRASPGLPPAHLQTGLQPSGVARRRMAPTGQQALRPMLMRPLRKLAGKMWRHVAPPLWLLHGRRSRPLGRLVLSLHAS